LSRNGQTLQVIWLETPTFFTELRARPELRARLCPEPKANPDTRAALREQELRRSLLSGQARLGHAFLDLYILALHGIGNLRPRARDDDSGTEGLIERYLDLLEQQRTTGDGQFRAFRELRLAAQYFDLIVDVNRPELRAMPLGDAGRDVGRLLGSQQPVGGMFGGINDTLVRQFRLPGYPFVLFPTDAPWTRPRATRGSSCPAGRPRRCLFGRPPTAAGTAPPRPGPAGAGPSRRAPAPARR